MTDDLQYMCFLDNAEEGDPHCAFDDGDVNSCDEAYELHQNGRCKQDCPHWRHVQSMRDILNRVEAEQLSSARIQQAALKRQREFDTNEFDLLMSMRPKSDEADTAWWCRPEIRGC